MDRAVRRWRKIDPLVRPVFKLAGAAVLCFIAYHFLKINDSIDVCTLLDDLQPNGRSNL